MLGYLWGVGRQERHQRLTDSYGRAPWSSGVRTLAEWRRNAGGALGAPGVLQESLVSGHLVLVLGLSKLDPDGSDDSSSGSSVHSQRSIGKPKKIKKIKQWTDRGKTPGQQ